MNAAGRADLFHDCFRGNCSEHETYDDCEKALSAQIKEAEREAFKEGIDVSEHNEQIFSKDSYAEGFHAAREEAAGHFSYCAERMRVWVQEHFPDATKESGPRQLMAALIRSIEEIRAMEPDQ